MIRPWLLRNKPNADIYNIDDVHEDALKCLESLGRYPNVCDIVRWWSLVDAEPLRTTVCGLTFPNPVGVAAGLDKYGTVYQSLSAFGLGFAEIGGITRIEQDGNKKPRIFMLPNDRGAINQMGFNNPGMTKALATLRINDKSSVPFGINIAKSKVTPLEETPEEYCRIFYVLFHLADYFVVNVSSPNTMGLRQFQNKKHLREVFQALRQANINIKFRENRNTWHKPMFVKIAPDLTKMQLDDILSVVEEFQIAGIVATNTTTSRDGLRTSTEEQGGLSGAPLRAVSTQIVRYLAQQLLSIPRNRRPIIIGVGGVFSAEDAYEKIRNGASLVQLLTAIFYEGPGIFRKINKGLLNLLKRDGFDHILEAIGADL